MSAPRTGQLYLSEDGGGSRWHLDGEPIHCGTSLELLMPGARWVSVRFELTGRPSRKRRAAGEELVWEQVPVLHLSTGGSWESWKPPAGKREGEYETVTCNGWSDAVGCTKNDDCLCNGKGTREREIQAPCAPQVILHDDGDLFAGCTLRWPPRRPSLWDRS